MSLAILFVDDDADIRTIVSLSLSLDPGVALRVAASGAEALDVVAAGYVPDVAVLDVMMPGMDGLALLERLHAQPSTAQVPVIFMTAQARQGDIATYLDRGAIGVITKPFDPINLGSQVRTLLDRAPGANSR
jgi:two-component system OmpR family response regulator